MQQPLDELMTKLELSNAQLVQASKEQLSFKNVQKGRTGRRITPNIQEKILNALLNIKPDLKLSRRDLFRYEMDPDKIQKIHEASMLIRDRKINFAQCVDRLAEAGITRYSVEVALGRITYFGTGGEVYIKEGPQLSAAASGKYDENAIRAALAEIRKGTIDYPGFLNRIQQAGVLTYDVNIRAREVRYRSETLSYKETVPLVSAVAAPAPRPTLVATPKKSSKNKTKSTGRKVSLKGRKAAKKMWKKAR